MSLLSLPNEILISIVECWFVKVSERESIWRHPAQRGDLQSLCLVCRRLRGIAQVKLYEKIKGVDDLQKVTAFLKQLETSPHLAPLVKELDVQDLVEEDPLPSEVGKELSPSADFHATSYSFIYNASNWYRIKLCQNIKKLRLLNGTLESFPLSLLQTPSADPIFPSLESCIYHLPYQLKDLTDLHKIGTIEYDLGRDLYEFREVPISNLIPFWTSPRLSYFSVGGSLINLVGNSSIVNRYHQRIEPRVLKEVEWFSLSCIFEVKTIQTLVAFRKVKEFSYVQGPIPDADYDFNKLMELLAHTLESFRYSGFEAGYMHSSRYPDMSRLSKVTWLAITAPSLANVSYNADSSLRPELLCKLPSSLQHLRIVVPFGEVCRHRLYEFLMDFVNTLWRFSSLKSLDLDFGFTSSTPHPFHWDHRRVSEDEREQYAVPDTELYEADGQTVEHHNLRRACEKARIELHAEISYLQGNNFMKARD